MKNKFINKKSLAVFLSFAIFIILSLPLLSFAAPSLLDPLVTCNVATRTNATTKQIEFVEPCNFNSAVAMINRIINLIIASAGIIFTLSCVWGGFLYMTSGIDTGNKAKAKKILWSTLQGFIIVLIAWLIVRTILVNLVADGSQSSILRFINN